MARRARNATYSVEVDEASPVIRKARAAGRWSVTVWWGQGPRAGLTETVDLAPIIFTDKAFLPLRASRELFEAVHISAGGEAIAWGRDDAPALAAEAVERLAEEAMSNAGFVAFLERNDLTFDAAAALIGISRRQVAYYTKDRPIPRSVALACAYIDEHGFGHWADE